MHRLFNNVLRLSGALLLAAWGGGGLTGCSPVKKDEAPPISTNKMSGNATSRHLPVGDADLLQGMPVGKAVPLSDADKAWRELQGAMQPPEAPAEWETNAPGKEVIAKFEKQNGVLAFKAAELAKDFHTRFATDEHAAEAREQERFLLSAAAQLGETNAAARLQALDDARLKDPNLSEDDRLQLRVEQLQRAMAMHSDDEAKGLTNLEKDVRALLKEFPKRPELSGLLLVVAEGWSGNNQPDRAKKLAQEVANSSAEAEVQQAAQALLKRLDRVGQPLEIKFKAVDGREIDLQAMKGKVVLIDFWATWCGPCMLEMPKVKAVYEKLRPKGFEIIGISLDKQRLALENVIDREKIPWPQSFEEGGSKFADQFGIESIPTMWLVDKKGLLRDLNAREDLAEKVEKLLAE